MKFEKNHCFSKFARFGKILKLVFKSLFAFLFEIQTSF